jgi:hypothetical protein
MRRQSWHLSSANPDAEIFHRSQYFIASESFMPRPFAPVDPGQDRSQLYNAEKTKRLFVAAIAMLSSNGCQLMCKIFLLKSI